MKSTVRTFVAVEAGPAVRAHAARLIEQFSAAGAGVKWVAPENLHLTLKFLGDVEQQDIPRVCEAVQRAVAEIPPFEFEIRGAGAFPNLRRPRTIWLGAGRGEDQMADLAHRVDKALQKLRFPREDRRFQAHLTIGRVRTPAPELAELAEMLGAAADAEVGTMAVEEAVVFSSDLRPTGPVYAPLCRAPLGA